MELIKNKTLYVVLIVLIIFGAIVYKVKGFNKELNYLDRQEFEISSPSALDISKVEGIAREILINKKNIVQKVERFDNTLVIISTEISEEEKQNIINKINEECNLNISNENVNIISIPETRIKDIIKPYIMPAVASIFAVLLYFIFAYNKLGVKNVLLMGGLYLILFVLAYYALIAITRVPFGRITNSISIGIFILTIGVLTIYFQNKKEELDIVNENKNVKENDE